MFKTPLFIISVAAAALICGFSLFTTAAASLALAAAGWLSTMLTIMAPTWFVVNDPACFTPLLVSKALKRAIAETLRCNHTLLVQISNPGVNPIRIEINPAGELRLGDSRRSVAVESAGRWIPDHPLPLLLKAGERSSLTFTPVAAQNVRVSTAPTPVKRGSLWFLLPALTLLALLDINAAAAALIAILAHIALSQRFENAL
ncbi:MAG: hypothetical protein PHO37_16050 [Kiritimatiellae bacterium]|nr:hypothetical protein [Kiritimatiellia bacterium]